MSASGGGAWGENLLNGVALGFFGNPYLRDYTHASKTFSPNSYENAPKLKFLFHVYFDINPEVYNKPENNFSVLVKTAKLPAFNFEVQTMNQYNRKRLVQTKIKYNPIDISFHDDCGDLINGLWYQYYTYYYKDAANPQVVFNGKRGAASPPIPGPGGTVSRANDSLYNERTTYSPSITGQTDWGYIGDATQPSQSGANPKKIPFFKNITIFGINRHNWIGYTLINPIITSFNHDQFAYDQANGVMENTMSIDYETVVYNQGTIDGDNPDNIITNFGDNRFYDRQLSPIATPGSNAKFLGQGGLVDAAGGFVKQLDAGGTSNILSAARTAGIAYNTFKNVNIKDVIQGELTKGLQDVLRGTSNPTRNAVWDIPRYGESGSNAGTAGTPIPGLRLPTPIGINPTAGTQNPSPYKYDDFDLGF